VKITEYLIAICLYVKISQETFHRDCLKHISHISGPFRGVHGKWEYVSILAGLIQPRECFFTKINEDCYIITHAGCIAAGVGRAFSCVCLFSCLFVRALKGKRLELSTPNLVHTYSIVDAQHALTQRSKGQSSRSHGYENRHGRTVASDACCYGRVLLLPAWVCMSIRLPTFSSSRYEATAAVLLSFTEPKSASTTSAASYWSC